jgi:GH15 family glucan-1,4-alpha-glucosidase
MPRSLVVGNGNLLINFDTDYNIRDIYYPYVGKDFIYRTRQSLGKWIYRVIQWKAKGRTTQHGGILHAR